MNKFIGNEDLRHTSSMILQALKESSIEEAENPVNAEANKKIKDVILKGPSSKYYQDVLDMGYKIEKEPYYDRNGREKYTYNVYNPNKSAYQSNYSSHRSDISGYVDSKNRAINGSTISKMSSSRRNKVDYKNFLDKDYSPRATGYRIEYGSNKMPGTNTDSHYMRRGMHSTPTYDDMNDGVHFYGNGGTKNIRDFKKAKAAMNKYNDPDYYNKNSKLGVYADGEYTKSDLDTKVNLAQKELSDFQASISEKIKHLTDRVTAAKAKQSAAKQRYDQNKEIVDKILKRK